MSKIARTIMSEFFDSDFYLSSNPDVAGSGSDPLDHYMLYGFREGRVPAPWFDVAQQRTAAGLGPNEDPFLHLITTAPSRARELQGLFSKKPSEAAARKVKPLMQPFYSLAEQASYGRTIVFTAIAGERHALPNNTTSWPDMMVFGDTPVALDGWSFRPSLYWDPTPKLTSLFHKYCLPSFFPDGTKLIWTDSRVSVQNHILTKISDHLDNADLCVFRHYERDCVYDELLAILGSGRGSFEAVQELENRLRDEGFPENDGLFETGLIGMKAGPGASRILRRVFGLARRHLARDQITLPLALRGTDLKVQVFNEGQTNLRNTPGVFVHPW